MDEKKPFVEVEMVQHRKTTMKWIQMELVVSEVGLRPEGLTRSWLVLKVVRAVGEL